MDAADDVVLGESTKCKRRPGLSKQVVLWEEVTGTRAVELLLSGSLESVVGLSRIRR